MEVDEASVTPQYYEYMMRGKRKYEAVLAACPNAEAPEEYKGNNNEPQTVCVLMLICALLVVQIRSDKFIYL